MLRVAALQFATTADVEVNLSTCLRMIDQAAEQHAPKLLVLPEFCNHSSWYDDIAQVAARAVRVSDPFLVAIGERAQRHGCAIVINCSLLNDDGRVTVSSLLYGPDGTLCGRSDKQALMGHENQFFKPALEASQPVDLGFCQVAMYACRDGVSMETARCLALQGAQILCNSLNSFALDEASLHVPARALENRCFVVAANKVGPLVPENMLEAVSSATHIPVPFLHGAGESQIVAPDGEVLARAPRDGEAVLVADLDPSQADDKRTPDGTDLFTVRCPELYRRLVEPTPEPIPATAAESLRVAIWTPDRDLEDPLTAACEAVKAFAREAGELLVLPELICQPNGLVTDASQAAETFEACVRALCEACADSPLHVVTSLVEAVDGRFFHSGVLLGHAGIIARQPQLLASARHGFAELGSCQSVFSMPYGRVAILVGDDARHPELAKLAALSGAHLLVCPSNISERAHSQVSLPARAAENRVCIIAASREHGDQGSGVILGLEREFTLMDAWEDRAFDGRVNAPIATYPEGNTGTTLAEVSPKASANKRMSQDTELLADRPYKLFEALLTPVPIA